MYHIIYRICRNGDFSILTGWGDGNSPLRKVTLRVLSQSECNRRYDVSKYNTNWPKINKTLPQLFEDNLLCAAVCIYCKKKQLGVRINIFHAGYIPVFKTQKEVGYNLTTYYL